MTFKLTSGASIVTAILLLSGLVLSFVVTQTVISNLLTVKFLFEDFFLYAILLAYPVLQLVGVFNFLEAKKIATYMNQWQDFHVSFVFEPFLFLVVKFIESLVCL